MLLLTELIKDSGMEGPMFADQKLYSTSCTLMGIYSDLHNVTIFAVFLPGILW